MNEGTVGGSEVITLAGVRERLAAYEEECRKEKSLPKTKITVFRVEDGCSKDNLAYDDEYETTTGGEPENNHHSNLLGNDDETSVGADDLDLEPDEHGDPDYSAAFNYSARPGFFRGGSFEDSDEENGKEPVEEKTPEQLAKDAKEEAAKKTFTILLEKEKVQAASAAQLAAASSSSLQETVVLQSFSSLQKRYLSAVAELRPEVDDNANTASINKQKIKAELRKEANRKERFSTLKSSYYAYAEARAAQDKREAVEDICVEEEIEKLEDEVVEEWVDYAVKAVEKVEILVAAKESGEVTETSEDGEDDDDDFAEMEKWREEAKKLKEEAKERKQRKAQQEKFRAERKEKAKERAARMHAKYLTKKKEKAEQAAAAKKLQESYSDSAAEAEEHEELESEHEAEVAEAADGTKKAEAADMGEHKKKKKSDHHGKKKKKDEKFKDEKKKKEHHHHKKKKGDDDGEDNVVDKKKEDNGGESDGDDAPDEKFPRNLDNTIWKNVLKFWSNKPKSVKEKSSKVIITTTPGSDCFRPGATSGNDSASFYWHKVEGDFECVVHIKGDFAKPYDKAGIMLRVDEKTWMMSGMEYFGEQLNNSSCITREISDWSLAPLPDEARKGCWFCVKRLGNKVESFYSMDTKTWIQTRQGLFTDTPTIKVGIATGSPTGEGFKVTFDKFWMKKK
jgi:uncharacterized protein